MKQDMGLALFILVFSALASTSAADSTLRGLKEKNDSKGMSNGLQEGANDKQPDRAVAAKEMDWTVKDVAMRNLASFGDSVYGIFTKLIAIARQENDGCDDDETTPEPTPAPVPGPTPAPTPFPTDSPTSPTACNFMVEQQSNMVAGFFFADRAVTPAEEQQMADATSEFFVDTVQAAFPSTYTGSPLFQVLSTSFVLDPPIQYFWNFTMQSQFSSCAPSLSDYQAILDSANYDVLWQEYVRPNASMGPGNLLVFIDSVSSNGDVLSSV